MPEEKQQQNMATPPSVDEKNTPSESGKYASSLKPLRTYQGDVNDAVHNNNVSVVGIAVAEQNRKYANMSDSPTAEEPTDSKIKNKFFMVVGSLLFILGAVTIGGVYYVRSEEAAKKASEKNTIISYSEIFAIPIASSTREDLIKTIQTKTRELKSPVGSVLFLNLTEGTLEASKDSVFTLLSPNMPPSLRRSLAESYMIGVYSFDINAPFIIMKTEDYGGSYAGMLKWEERMISDIGKLYNISPPNSSSTPYVFEDETMINKDLRVVKNQSQKTILLYSFVDKNTILITSNESIFKAIVGKYMMGKVTR